MIDQEYSNNQILEFIHIFKKYFMIHEAVLVFVKKGKLKLLKWAEL
jgi:hypothetical protein